MPGYNGSGTFERTHNWVSDRDASIKITASRMDAEHDGFATGLSNCITRDGQSVPTANIPMGGFKLTGLAAGTAAGESLRFEQAVLLSAGAAQTITTSAGGEVLALESTDAGASQGPSLSFYRNSASPLASDQLGAINWYGKDSGGTKTQYAGIGLTLTDPADTSEDAILYFSVMTGGTFVSELALLGTALYPIGNDGLALGLATLSWSDLFLASGAVINFNNGNYTVTHSSGDLLFSGTLSLGNADTTLARSAAGMISVEGVTIEPGANRASFLAHKNGSDQAIAGTSETKVTFGTESFDVGSKFSSSTWTPPAGTVLITANVTITDATDGQLTIVSIWKNGSRLAAAREETDALEIAHCSVSVVDQADGNDTYEVYVVNGGGSYTVYGLAEATNFSGTMV